jgi:Putative Actinobacterial Holin-X, holin superfamily III
MLVPFRSRCLLDFRHSVVPGDGGGTAADAAAAAGTMSQQPLPTPGLLDELSSVLTSGRTVVSSFLELASLEAQRAGLTLVWMIALGIIGAICAIAAWLGLMAALAMWAVALGAPPIAAVIGVALINAGAGGALIYVCINMSRDLLFSATRRQIAGKTPERPAAP